MNAAVELLEDIIRGALAAEAANGADEDDDDGEDLESVIEDSVCEISEQCRRHRRLLTFVNCLFAFIYVFFASWSYQHYAGLVERTEFIESTEFAIEHNAPFESPVENGTRGDGGDRRTR